MLFTSVALAKEAPQAHKAVELSILHINDHHSYLEPHETRINLNGQQTKVDIGGFLLSMQNLTNCVKIQKIHWYCMQAMPLLVRFTSRCLVVLQMQL